MSRLFLIRHGEPQSAWGVGDDDPGLSERGREQARAAADALARTRLDQIITSPKRRCQETAAPLTQALERQARVEPRFSEVIAPQGVDRRAWLGENFGWAPGAAPILWDGRSEDLKTWRADILEALRQIEGDCALFTHFVAINTILGAVLGREETIVCRPDYASITELANTEGALRLVGFGAQMTVGMVT